MKKFLVVSAPTLDAQTLDELRDNVIACLAGDIPALVVNYPIDIIEMEIPESAQAGTFGVLIHDVDHSMDDMFSPFGGDDDDNGSNDVN